MRRPSLALPLLLAAAMGCRDATGPGRLGGTFTLRSIDGQPLPVLVAERRMLHHATNVMATVREYTDAVRLVVLASGTDTLTVVYRVDWEPDTGENPAPIDVVHGATVDVRADSVCLRVGFPGECGGFPLVRRSRDEIVLRMIPGVHPATWGEYVFRREGR